MKRSLALGLVVLTSLGCGSSDRKAGGDDAGVADAAAPTFRDCQASDQSFVRNTYLAVRGYRPRSQAEVNVYTDLMAAIREHNEAAARSDAGAVTEIDPQRAVALSLMTGDDFVDRWVEQVTDALLVPRIEDQSQQSCYGDAERASRDRGELAAHVRDKGPDEAAPGGAFTMLDLARSAIEIDDLSPIYRGHLFALVSRAIPAANVPPVQAELARREDFGNTFDAAFLNRDMTCLACHNSEQSITEHPDPEQNRHWDLPGFFEAAIYGRSTGNDPNEAHAPFRYDGFVADGFSGDPGTSRPWEWDASCGAFDRNNLQADPAGVVGRFASVTGDKVTVYDLEAALRRGFETIAEDGLTVKGDGTIADPDSAFAYLVASKMVENVWREVVGTPLTIANYFPRNQAARDVLHELTENFVRNRFSLRELLVDIVKTPYFNRLAPEAGCGAEPYNMPPIYDPWSTADEVPERRNNSSADAVVPLSARTLLRTARMALEWRQPFFEDFPERPFSINACINFYPTCDAMNQACQQGGECCYAHEYWCKYVPAEDEPETSELRAFERGIGIFLKPGERGFRGLDFQARLVFENRYGKCRKIDSGEDFIDKLEQTALADDSATLGDVVAAAKDRLIGESRVHHDGEPSEKAVLESLLGARLDAPASAVEDLGGKLRSLCGALVSSPQFLLSGMAAPDSRYEPVLTPADWTYSAVCAHLAEAQPISGVSIDCSSDRLSLAP